MGERDTGEIYFVGISRLRLVKIGYASDVSGRLSVLQTASPFDLKLIDSFTGTKGDERAIQKFLRPHRYRREWFRAADDVYDLVEDLADYRLGVWLEAHKNDPTYVFAPENPWPGLENVPVSPFVKELTHV